MGGGKIRDGHASVTTEEESEAVDGAVRSDGLFAFIPMIGDIDVSDKSGAVDTGEWVHQRQIFQEADAEDKRDDDEIND